MSRRKIAIEVHRKSETLGKPDLLTTVTQKAALVYQILEKAGSRGITCRDWHGYDLRHFIRVLRNKGIGIDREWEKNSPEFGGQHGRWRLRKGHSHEVVSYSKMKKPAGRRALNPEDQIAKSGGHQNEIQIHKKAL